MADENIENQINTFGTAQAANGAQATGFTTGEKLAGAGAATGAYKFRKPIIKAAGKSLGALAGPVPIAATYPIFGFDPKSSLDRTFLGAELAAAPSLVKAATSVTDKIKTPALRKAAELFTTVNPRYAMRLARAANPVGLATLAGEGVYNVGKYSEPNYYIGPDGEPTFYKREKAADVLPTMLDVYDQADKISREQGIPYQEALYQVNLEKFKKINRADGGRASHMGGGIASIRRPNAIPPESGPTPQGLPSMYNRVKKI